MAKKKDNFVGDVIKTSVGNMVGVGLIGATSQMTNALPAGDAKTFAGTAVGLQGVALLGPNIKLVKKSLSKKSIW